MYQRKVINNRKTLTHQQHFTYQRKGNHEVQIQALYLTVADLQNQMNNLGSESSGGGGGELGTMWNFIKTRTKYINHIYIHICGTDLCI